MKRYVKTYHAGDALDLEIASDRFVSRAAKESLTEAGFAIDDRLSTASFAIRAENEDIDGNIARARELGPAFPLYFVAGTQQAFLVSDRIFIRFHPRTNPARQSDITSRYGTVVERYDEDEVLLRLSSSWEPVAAVTDLTDRQLVALAEHDINHQIATAAVRRPIDFIFSHQWHLHRDVASSLFDPRASTMASEAWNTLGSYGERDVVVGITDGGCDVTNPDFRPASEKFAGWGYFVGTKLVTNLNAKAVVGEMKRNARHGTAMAGLIGAAVNDEYAVGVAPGVRLLPIGFETTDDGRLVVSTSCVRSAFRHLNSRVDVISNSWSVGEVSLWSATFRQEMVRMAHTGGRRGKGIIFVFAAGNSNCPLDRSLRTEQDVPVDNGRDFLGRFAGPRKARTFRNELVGLPGVLHVGAISSLARRSHYSNYGRGLRLCAPSDNFHLYQCPLIEPNALPLNASPSESILTDSPGGTSAATAIVAGVAALVVSANPSLSGANVISILQQTATRDFDFTPYPKTPASCAGGDGSFDVSPISPFDDGSFRDTGHPDGPWSPWFGFGSVNAARAVARARDLADAERVGAEVKTLAELSS